MTKKQKPLPDFLKKPRPRATRICKGCNWRSTFPAPYRKDLKLHVCDPCFIKLKLLRIMGLDATKNTYFHILPAIWTYLGNTLPFPKLAVKNLKASQIDIQNRYQQSVYFEKNQPITASEILNRWPTISHQPAHK